MILIFFFQQSFSLIWKYNSSEIKDKLIESEEIPIFMFMYSTYCALCEDVILEASKLSKQISDRTVINYTEINCVEDPETCSRFNITRTPSIFLISGENPRYWPRTDTKTVDGWNEFIDKYIGLSVKKINSKEKLFNLINNISASENVIFCVVTPNEQDLKMKSIRRLSRKYTKYNVSFVYILDSTVETSTLTAYKSTKCSIQYDESQMDILQFIEKYKFGPFHKYNYEEWKNETSSNDLVVVYTKDSITQGTKISLSSIQNYYCDVSFGWISAQESNDLLSLYELEEHDLPSLYMQINRNNVFHFIKEDFQMLNQMNS